MDSVNYEYYEVRVKPIHPLQGEQTFLANSLEVGKRLYFTMHDAEKAVYEAKEQLKEALGNRWLTGLTFTIQRKVIAIYGDKP